MRLSRLWFAVLCGPLVLLIAAATSQASTVWYVNAAATGNNTGTSWPDAFTDLQQALDAAQAGHEIWVAAGTYKPSARTIPSDPRSATFSLTHAVSIYGGFAGGESSRDQRDWTRNQVILSGDLNGDDGGGNKADNAYHVFIMTTSGVSATLDGLTVAGGYANATSLSDGVYGGGLYATVGGLTVRNCTFTDNFATLKGGGLYAYTSGGLTIQDSLFEANTVDSGSTTNTGGGAVYSGSGAVIQRCTFRANSARSLAGQICSSGGAVTIYYGGVRIEDCQFQENTCTCYGGAVSNISSSSFKLVRCTFTGNFADEGAGAVVSATWSPGSTISDCDFVDNSTSLYTGDGGGAVLTEFGQTYIKNSRFIRNTSSKAGGLRLYANVVTVTNCVFEDNVSYTGGAIQGCAPIRL